MRPRREKVFGPGQAIPHDRNAKVRINAYFEAWNARRKRPRQHRGPLSRTTIDVMKALLFGIHNSADGRCFPSYEAIAAKARCCRSMVAPALRALERTGIFSVQNRITRRQTPELDLFGRWVTRWRVVRTSNAYAFRDPLRAPSGLPASKADNQPGTPQQGTLTPTALLPIAAESGLGRLNARLARALGGKDCIGDAPGEAITP